MCKFYIKEKLHCLSDKFENIQEDFSTKKERKKIMHKNYYRLKDDHPGTLQGMQYTTSE